MVTALPDKRGDHGLLVALCAREHRRLLAAVIVAPLPQADERDMKVAALSGQVVFVSLRPFLIGNPLEDSTVDPLLTICDRLPPVATTGLHKGSIRSCQLEPLLPAAISRLPTPLAAAP